MESRAHALQPSRAPYLRKDWMSMRIHATPQPRAIPATIPCMITGVATSPHPTLGIGGRILPCTGTGTTVTTPPHHKEAAILALAFQAAITEAIPVLAAEATLAILSLLAATTHVMIPGTRHQVLGNNPMRLSRGQILFQMVLSLTMPIVHPASRRIPLKVVTVNLNTLLRRRDRDLLAHNLVPLFFFMRTDYSLLLPSLSCFLSCLYLYDLYLVFFLVISYHFCLSYNLFLAILYHLCVSYNLFLVTLILLYCCIMYPSCTPA